jgi:hypothetical protein
MKWDFTPWHSDYGDDQQKMNLLWTSKHLGWYSDCVKSEGWEKHPKKSTLDLAGTQYTINSNRIHCW